MDLTNPNTWKCPEFFHPDCDGIWEISQLKKLAIGLLSRNPELKVELNVDDQTCTYFSIFGDSSKLGEAYVNRQADNSDEILFSIFYGKDEDELHSSSVDECIDKLGHSDGFE